MPRDGASIRPGASARRRSPGYRRDREGGPRLKPSYWGRQLVSRILRYGQPAIKPPRFRHVIVALRSRVNSLAENKVDGRIPIPEQLLRGGRRRPNCQDDANGTEKEATGTSKGRLRDETLPIANLEAQSIDDRDHSQVVDSGALNPELFKGKKGGRIYPKMRLRDRIDAIIAHEYEELRHKGSQPRR